MLKRNERVVADLVPSTLLLLKGSRACGESSLKVAEEEMGPIKEALFHTEG